MSKNYNVTVGAVVLTLLLALTVLVYLPGLPGPFLFDDTAHVSKNLQVQITDLGVDSLVRAWNSSYFSGSAARPLAQLSFGVDHALAGLDSRHFKTTNLILHLLTGLLVFALARQLTRVLARSTQADMDTPWPALLVTALWLLHPINLTPVLYVVQRMTSLSALFVLAGLWCHVSGRLRMADGRRGGVPLALAGLPVALVGVLAKESALLYPLFVLVLEWTLLRQLQAPRRTPLLIAVAVLPLLAGATYFLNHPGLVDYSSRDFSLVERLLSEARILWLYLRMLAMPDLSLLGLFHDDVATSHALLTPWTTLPAVLGWLVLTPLALIFSKRWPVAGFAVLFFLAGHAMESTVFPLELVFEHRNYLPSFGPLLAVAWLLTRPYPPQVRRLAGLAAVLVIAALAFLTYLRAGEWSNHDRLVLNEVRHHPGSPRANFRTAQILMEQMVKPGQDSRLIYQAARHHFEQVRRLAPANDDALFGLIMLELYANRDPAADVIQTLIAQLRSGAVDPSHLSISQFAFLVRWQQHASTHKLPHQQVLAIFDAVLHNPGLNAQGRATVMSATRAYHDLVLNDPAAALPYARQAVATWPPRWHYHYRLVQLLLRLGHLEEAETALQAALSIPSSKLHADQVEELRLALESASKHAN